MYMVWPVTLQKFEKGVYSVMARDLIEYISKALMKLEDE